MTNNLSADQVRKLIARRRITKDRFKLSYSEEQAFELVKGAVQAEVDYRHRQFRDSDELDRQVRSMAQWLTGPSQRFGMMLAGGTGNGKSTMMKATQQLIALLRIKKPYEGTYGMRIVDAQTLVQASKNQDLIKKLMDEDMLGIDDLGTEPAEVMDYGNIYTPVIDCMIRRYEEQRFTIITTNLTPPEIRERYGDRVADRFNEMFERIIYTNRSYRQ